MNLTTERGIDDGTEVCAWGMTPNGNPVLALKKGGVTVKVEMSPAQAKEMACGGIYVATFVEQQRAQKAGQASAPSSVLVAPSGLPLGGKH